MTREEAIQDMYNKLEKLAPGCYRITPKSYNRGKDGKVVDITGGETIDILDGGEVVDTTRWRTRMDGEDELWTELIGWMHGYLPTHVTYFHNSIQTALQARRKAEQERAAATALADKVKAFMEEQGIQHSVTVIPRYHAHIDDNDIDGILIRTTPSITITAVPKLVDGMLEFYEVNRVAVTYGEFLVGDIWTRKTTVEDRFPVPMSSATFAELLKGA